MKQYTIVFVKRKLIEYFFDKRRFGTALRTTKFHDFCRTWILKSYLAGRTKGNEIPFRKFRSAQSLTVRVTYFAETII